MEIKSDILKKGILEKPIVVDKNTNIILDGHHRFNIFKQLDLKKIPVFFINYQANDIILDTWKKVKLSKADIIKIVEAGEKFPYKTTKHMIKISNEKIHISRFVKKINFPIKKLIGKKNENCK